MAKNDKKIYEGYKKHQKLWNTVLIIFFAVIGVGAAVLNGSMEIDIAPIVIGQYQFTWFHLVMLLVLLVLLGFGIVALKRDSSEEQQEIYRQEREEAIRLRQEVMAERKQEMQEAYDAMKRRRAERLAAQGIAATAAQADAVDAVETVEAVEAESAEAVEIVEEAAEQKEEEKTP